VTARRSLSGGLRAVLLPLFDHAFPGVLDTAWTTPPVYSSRYRTTRSDGSHVIPAHPGSAGALWLD
jgi:hypothetical protein